MKKIIFASFVFIFFSCNDSNKKDVILLKKEISSKEQKIKELKKINDTLVFCFKNPLEVFNAIKKTELMNPPDSIIKEYELLVKEYPNTFWSGIAKERIEIINSKRKYWSINKGWKILKLKPISDAKLIIN